MEKKRYMICNSAEGNSTIFIDLNEEEFKLIDDIAHELSNNSERYAPTLIISPVKITEMAKIWTKLYTPFVMGGETYQAIYTTLAVEERKTINGFDFFSFKSPRGGTRICEAQTGGIIASSFEELEKNISGVPREFLQSQINNQVEVARTAKVLSYDKFFNYYKD